MRLVADDNAPPPAGFVIARKAAEPLLEKIYIRLGHYASLRLTATRDDLIVLAPSNADLPWHADIQFYLYESGPAYLPIGLRLDAPTRWRGEVLSRLAAELAQPLPLLLMPPLDGSDALRCVSLSGAKALQDVDLPRLAGECAT